MEKQFEALEELVKDEDSIVTVPSYALKAKISYEKSCEVINKYFEVNKGSDNIQPTFVLTGLQKDSGKIAVVQVNENTINDEKAAFKDVFSESVFSIQKAKDINYNVITLVDPVDNLEVDISSLGAVLGKNCIKRTLHKKVLPTLPPATVKGKSTIFSNQNNLFKTKSNTEEVKKEEVSQKSTTESKQAKTTQGGIESLFNKAAQNKKPEVKPKPAEQKPKLNGGISSFLSKTSSKTSSSEESVNSIKKEQNDVLPNSTSEEKDDIKINEKEIKTSNSKKSELFDSDTDEEVTVQTQSKPSKSVENNSLNKSKKKVAKKRSNTKTANDKTEKKRKRIIVEDSESEDILGSDKSEEEEDVIESSIYEEKEPQKEVKPLLPKNKRRKAVTKTFEDKDGFFVTQTEYVYETASEDENEPQNKIAKKEPTKQPLEKKPSNNLENEISPNKAVKGKKGGKKAAATANQPTLMNFFKKK